MLRALQECGNDVASQSKRSLEVVQRRVLLEMIVASVEQEMSVLNDSSLEGVVDPAVLAAQRSIEDPSKETAKKNKHGLQEKLTVAMLQALPELLKAFKTDIHLVRSLTALPKFFRTYYSQ